MTFFLFGLTALKNQISRIKAFLVGIVTMAVPWKSNGSIMIRVMHAMILNDYQWYVFIL